MFNALESNQPVTPLFRTPYCASARTYLQVFQLIVLLFCILALQPAIAADATVKSARMGLTPDYTRITLESNQPLDYELSMLSNPHRVVIDLNRTKITPALAALPDKVDAIDPYVQKIRVGQFKPDVIRLVFDLKSNVVPRAFVMEPKDNFAHRLILDIHHPDKAIQTAATDNVINNAPSGFETDVLDELVATLMQSGTAEKKEKPAQWIFPHGPKPQQLTTAVTPAKQPGNIPATQNRKPEKVKVPRILIVAIDPGHGGKDPGAVGQQGTYEKDVTLAIARKLKERIDKEPNMRAVLTRNGDYYISLPQRRINARRANADLFISIHADANPKSHAHGSSVFTLSEHGATSTTASWLANKENSVDNDLMGGIDITSKSKDIRELLLDLSLNATINDSVKLAEYVLKQLGGINHLHKRNVEQAGFAVLKSPDIPSILVETAFLSNPKEEVKLRSTQYQNRMADAMFLGIKKYFSDNPALARSEMAQVK
ncbi:N-acetylmuramoyl-L-alanine amidase [Nitrosomonas sp. sh817]|uniref:N-acetylmuramoyl-L-alanine amidase n=1 Tax=Nitrosomonas sp. sh817 TaxID=3070658 RepID=UPI0027DD9419|nr:N-acetylmuramoyl-L-alanine amidase [Nitrosomonas sp. sh817]WMJ07695.1 N-acetylmuramoyl-L-alanine amidase [Nitrosomonas sp. sh817]